MEYKFYLRDPKVTTDWTEVEEPDGWDAVSFKMMRSDKYTGFENVYSDNLVFVNDGADYLKAIFDIYLFDALIDFKWEFYCNGVLDDSFIGAVNMITYSEFNNEVSVKVEDSSFSRKVLNRIDTIVNLDKETSIEGVAISPMDKLLIPLHSKVISLQATFLRNEFLSDYSENGVNDESFNALYFPIDVSSDEYGTAVPTSVMFDINASLPYADRYLFTAPVAGVYTFEYDLKGFVQETTSGARSFNFSIAFTTSSNVDYQVRPITAHSQTGGTITIPYEYAGLIDITLGAGESIALYSRLFNSTPSRSADLRQVIERSELKIRSNSIFETSQAYTYKIYEALNRVVESITDTQDAIISDFFGRTDSTPTAYDVNGCGSWLTTLTGKMLRGFINEDLTLPGSAFSLQQIFDALDCEYSIGFRVEDVAGVLKLRIEPKEYFYNTETVMQFANVSDIKKTVSVKDIYNNFETGYSKWELEEVNGIDEINTMHQYSIPITTGANKLSKICQFIAGAYPIEYTRRQQFKTTPTKDWKFDNDNFFIAMSRIDQSFATIDDDPYKLEGVTYPHTYLAGSVPERNESFDYVQNYISPETAYNIRLSPTRMAVNWYPILAISITQDQSKPITFQSGTGNIFEMDKIADLCEVDTKVRQNQDILKYGLNEYKSEAFYAPIIHQFDYPGTFADFRNLRRNSNKSIGFSCGNSNFTKGFIKELSIEPNSEDGGILHIIALEGGCTQGAFDSGFDNGFDIGSC